MMREALHRINRHESEPRHSKAFWWRVERVMPDYEERKGELAREGGGYY